ncbi:hypothetical protein AVEN_199547-1 [Araneus ventricosus]|uniref:Uncharacterized protein n=1 Tax=Araneus ventricosus TaxID=182803 RepID=A0A4Y2BI99_ARAVE|nr:hypothetical protein AVEN_8347-1 [Araneus ventricosus]GBL90974.1 hypothetical protein AVEN_95051-1 [Araneus ventricosus]GBL90996.1 hypothetical protein AVEN_147458-1 [Araneus ventricosus]GBL91011.1 hypothetical protein AVEN_199547-1 [Araneus ventricosus]
MTCCTREEQLFAWQTAYPDTTIDVMNEKSGFIRPGKSKCKNDYLPCPAAVKYHSHLTTCLPRHPDEFIEKCGNGHNVLARLCILQKYQ